MFPLAGTETISRRLPNVRVSLRGKKQRAKSLVFGGGSVNYQVSVVCCRLQILVGLVVGVLTLPAVGYANTPKRKVGVIGHSQYYGEVRLPIHWVHLQRKPPSQAVASFAFEQGYGEPLFGNNGDRQLRDLGYDVLPRTALLNQSDIVISLKPTDEPRFMKAGSVLLGWTYTLDRTIKPPDGFRKVDFSTLRRDKAGQVRFLSNNATLSGACGVAQTLDLLGVLDPHAPALTRRGQALILGFGSVGRGAAIECLKRGFKAVTVFTQRSPLAVAGSLLPGTGIQRMELAQDATHVIDKAGQRKPLNHCAAFIDADIIINGTPHGAANIARPLFGVEELNSLKPGVALVDPMLCAGQPLAIDHQTTAAEPVQRFAVPKNGRIWLNSYDGMPNYRPTASTEVISQELVACLEPLLRSIPLSPDP